MYQNRDIAIRFITHEIGHIFDRAVCASNQGGACSNIWAYDGTARSDLTARGLGRKGHEGPLEGEFWGFAGGWENWQFGETDENGEIWADMFLGWSFDTWATAEPLGTDRQNYMNIQMPQYLMKLLGYQ